MIMILTIITIIISTTTTTGIFEAKGLECIRRDQCPLTQKLQVSVCVCVYVYVYVCDCYDDYNTHSEITG